MIYELVHEKNEGTGNKPRLVRLYRNSRTGTETKLQLLHTDKQGEKWWGFTDLYKIPYSRLAMVRNITDLYAIGLSLKDITKWCEDMKGLLRSADAERYEKAYAKVLEIETTAKFGADPIQQQLALCTVYVLSDEERIDYFDESISVDKLTKWKTQPELVAFFLTWHTGHIHNSIRRLERISKTVLNLQEKQNFQMGSLKP